MPELYPYQETGVEFLTTHPRAYLADEMGLGKTVQAIVAAKELKVCSPLVVCPASVQENWKREWEAWAGPGVLTVTSYSKLIRGRMLERLRWDLVILDEAHYCKTPSAQRTRAALRLAAKSKRAWLLSGTPIPNDPRELWPAIRALWPDLAKRYGTRNAFEWMDRWCVWTQGEYGYRVFGLKPAAREQLVPELRHFMMRRRLKDIALQLPPLRFDVQYLPKDPELAKGLAKLGARTDDQEHMSTLRRILGQYKAGPVATEILRELRDEQYEDIIVFYHHHDTGNELWNLLGRAGRNMYGFDGSMSSAMRQKEIDGFQERGGIFLAQQGAAGIGITLTRGHEVVLVEPAWSPEENFQAIKRAHRIGQKQPVRARIFAVPDSLDEALMGTLKRKSRMIAELVG